GVAAVAVAREPAIGLARVEGVAAARGARVDSGAAPIVVDTVPRVEWFVAGRLAPAARGRCEQARREQSARHDRKARSSLHLVTSLRWHRGLVRLPDDGLQGL